MYLFRYFIPAATLIRVIVLTSIGLVLGVVLQDMLAGGHPWHQGDWLINDFGMPVRRGVFGGWILHLSDGVGLSPVLITGLLQSLTLIALAKCFFTLVNKDTPSLEVLLLLSSPAMIFLFWAGDLQGSLRKEMLGHLAILLAAVGVFTPRLLPTASGTLLLGLGAWGHMINVMLVPLFAVLVIWGALRHGNWTSRLILLAMALGAAGAATLYAIHHPIVSNAHDICTPLVERGVTNSTPSGLCGGAIAFMQQNADSAQNFVLIVHGSIYGAVRFIVTLGLSTIALLVFAYHMQIPRWLFWISVMVFLTPTPLYVMAWDWGRFLSLQYFAAAIPLLVGLRTGDITPRRAMSPLLLKRLLLLALVIAIDHVEGVRLFGVFQAPFYFLN